MTPAIILLPVPEKQWAAPIGIFCEVFDFVGGAGCPAGQDAGRQQGDEERGYGVPHLKTYLHIDTHAFLYICNSPANIISIKVLSQVCTVLLILEERHTVACFTE